MKVRRTARRIKKEWRRISPTLGTSLKFGRMEVAVGKMGGSGQVIDPSGSLVVT